MSIRVLQAERQTVISGRPGRLTYGLCKRIPVLCGSDRDRQL
jgi:hypothetical protein